MDTIEEQIIQKSGFANTAAIEVIPEEECAAMMTDLHEGELLDKYMSLANTT